MKKKAFCLRRLLLPLFIFVQVNIPGASLANWPSRKVYNTHVYEVMTYLHHISDINYRDGEYKIELLLYVYSVEKSFDSLLMQKLAVQGAKDFEIVNIPMWSRLDSRRELTERRVFKINCTMIKEWNLGNYPFGKQQLDIWLYSMVPSERVMLQPKCQDSLKKDPVKYNIGNGWHYFKDSIKIKKDIIDDIFGRKLKYSALHYQLPLNDDRPELLFIKLFLGMYVAFSVAFIALFIPFNREEPRFGLPVGGLFAAIGNKYIIEALLPVSTDFNLADTLHSITIVSILLVIAYSAILLFLVEKKKSYDIKNGNCRFFIFRSVDWLKMDLKKFNLIIISSLSLLYVYLNLYFIWTNYKAGLCADTF